MPFLACIRLTDNKDAVIPKRLGKTGFFRWHTKKYTDAQDETSVSSFLFAIPLTNSLQSLGL